MISKFFRATAALGALALIGLSAPSLAATSPFASLQVLCAPEQAVGNANHLVINPTVTSPVAGNGQYTLNSQGCAAMAQSDWGYFQSQGFVSGVSGGQITVGPFTAQTTTTNSPVLPANAKIDSIVIQEISGNALTGGLDVGVAGSSDATIVSAFAVAANAVTAVPQASILKMVFPTSGVTGPVAQQIFFNAHTGWNSGSIWVTIKWSYF